MEYTWRMDLTREQFKAMLVALKEGCAAYNKRASQAKTLEDMMFWQEFANKSDDVYAYLFSMDHVELIPND